MQERKHGKDVSVLLKISHGAAEFLERGSFSLCAPCVFLCPSALPLIMLRRVYVDQMRLPLELPFPPSRIISLVPSQTELLADLGLTNEVVGITKFCVHPEGWLKSKKIIGGTKQFDFDSIDALKPDLILGNKEENYREGIGKLRTKYPVWMSDIVSVEDALRMIESVGELTSRLPEAQKITCSVREAFESLTPFSGQSVLYMIWRKPWMAAGPATFIHEVLTKLGLVNVITEPRYPELATTVLKELNPDYVFLSSEPFPFQVKHEEEIRQVFPSSKIVHVDGEMFSWYGSRLIRAAPYFKNLAAQI